MKSIKELSVLVVDDEPAIPRAVCGFLEKFCKEVHSANNGVDGLKKCLTNKYDIILTDYHMPKMNGDKLCKAAKQITVNSKIIVMSAGIEYTDCGHCFLQKPIDFHVLLETFEKVLNIPKKTVLVS